MPRRSSGAIRRERTPAVSDGVPLGGREEQVHLPEGLFLVRSIADVAALKVYRCPGCQQEIQLRVSHVVVWPADGDGTERRHWHSSCWQRRSTRGGPGRLPW